MNTLYLLTFVMGDNAEYGDVTVTVQGVFTTREAAVKAARDCDAQTLERFIECGDFNEYVYFVQAIVLNADPHDTYDNAQSLYLAALPVAMEVEAAREAV